MSAHAAVPALAALLLLCIVGPTVALDNGLALTPPMGFANWNSFGCNYNSTTIRNIAQFLVDSGMADAGYKTIIIQECITPAGHRDSKGRMVPDPNKFPEGFPALVDFIHSLGLKAGIYTDVGPMTCAKYEGSFGHYEIDAQTFADWGIDFVEMDSCFKPQGHEYRDLYGQFRDALNATGRPIVFYSCVQGQDNVSLAWGSDTANLWRTTGDICGPNHANWGGVVRNFYGNAKYPQISGPGHWQDPDMLMTGMPGLSELEWRSHFSLWAISAAPLWAGADLTNMSLEALNIYMNFEVIAVDQDPLGMAGRKADDVLAWRVGADGDPVTLQPCAGGATGTTWAYNASTMELQSRGQCLTVLDCSTSPGAPIGMWDCLGNKGGCPANQQWKMTSAGGSTVSLVSQISHLAAASNDATPRNGTRVVQDTKGAAFTPGPAGSFQLAANPALCLSSVGTARSSAEAWYKPLVDADVGGKRVAVLFFNPDDSATQQVTVSFAAIGLTAATPVHARDLWAHDDLGSFSSSFTSVALAPHDTMMVIFTQ